MIDQIKSNLTNSYLMFVFEFADPQTVNKEQINETLGVPIRELFQSQKQADRSKKVLGKIGFGRAVVCYFNSFNNSAGIDFKTLDQELTRHRKIFLRHLGKDKVNYLSLMISIANVCEPQRRGLLSA